MNLRTAIALFFAWSIPVKAQTQLEMNTSTCAEYKMADEKLNNLYQRILGEHKGDPQFTAKLKAAQLAWLKFRDAELEAIYPPVQKQQEYGSVYPMCSCAEQTARVKQRIEQLSSWLSAEEGDVCRGSR